MMKYYLFFFNLCGITPLLAMTLPEHELHTYDCNDCGNLSHEALELSWPLTNQLPENNSFSEQKSLKYQEKITLEQLQKGLVIHTQAPGAVVRITPAESNHHVSKPQFYVQKNQLSLSIKEASALSADEESLQDGEFDTNTLAIFRLKNGLGAGLSLSKKVARIPAAQTLLSSIFLIVNQKYH